MSRERRAYARVAVPISARLIRGSEETELPVRDVSVAGIFLYTSKTLGPQGTELTLKLAHAEGIGSLLIRGRVAHVETDPLGERGDTLGVGIQFVDVGPEQHQGLVSLIERAMLGQGTTNRAFPRVAHTLGVVCLSPEELPWIMNDLGEGGMGLTVQRAFAKGDAVIIEVRYGEAPAIKLPGWVVWSEPVIAIAGHFRIGVRFSKLSPLVRAQLLDVLRALCRR